MGQPRLERIRCIILVSRKLFEHGLTKLVYTGYERPITRIMP